MSFLQPTEAPRLHLELLPTRARAVDVSTVHLTTTKYDGPSIHISTWASGLPMPCVGDESLESFKDNNCESCDYYTDEIEVYSGGEYEIKIDGELRPIASTFYTYSPCSCYENGIGDISFPCYAGYEPESVEDTPLSTELMRYTAIFLDKEYFSFHEMRATQQRLDYLEDEGGFHLSDTASAVNTFNDDSICWGSNDEAYSLLQAESIYTTSPANQDLLNFESHRDNMAELLMADDLTPSPHLLDLSHHTHRGKAVVVASARTSPQAYLLLASSGVKLKPGLAYINAQYYKNVAVDDDHVLDVWATDVLPTGIRLLFLHDRDDNKNFNCLFIGQVPSDFNLEPCKSLPAPSSELAELVSN